MASTVCATGFTQWKKSCSENNLQAFKYKFLVERGTTVASSLADLATLSTLTDLVQSEDLVPLPEIVQIDRDDQDAEYTDFGLGRKKKTRNQVRRETNLALIPLCSHKRLRTLDSTDWDVILMDEEGNAIFREVASDDYQGFPVDLEFNLMDWDTGYTSPIYITYLNSTLFDDNGMVVEADYVGTDVIDAALETVTLEVSGTPTADEIVVKVYSTCGADSDGAKNYPVKGLVGSDFEAEDITSIDSLTESPDGTYTFETTDLATGYFRMKQPSDMTTSGYKGGNSLSITI